MATVTSYGSITIVDITDIGEFSVYPQCTLPTTVIYSPDDGNYTPDWSIDHLTITPVAYYAGAQKTTGITWTWERQQGASGTRVTVVDGQNGEGIAQNGTLTVSTNKFPSGSNYSQLTYIVTATYPDSNSGLGRNLVAEGQITFSKIEQGTSAKIARINGDNIFKYNSAGAVVGSEYITLTGTVTNCSIAGWKYYNNSNSTWTTYPTKTGASPATYPSGSTGATLNVYEDDSVFNNDNVRIRLTTNDNSTYDEFTIYKLRDGAAGTETTSAILTNEDQMIPASQNGTIPATGLNGAVTRLRIYDGGHEVNYNDWTISIEAENGITIEKSTDGQNWFTSANDHYTWAKVTGMTVDSGNVNFTATKGSTILTKQFSLLKVKAGQDASTFYIHDLELDTIVLNLSAGTTPVFTPGSFTATAKRTEISTTGATTATWSQGKIRVTEYYNTNTSTVVHLSSSSEGTYTHSPTSSNVIKILVELLDAGGTNILDSQTILVTSDGSDGAPGDPGPQGDAAVSVILGNEAQVFPCTNSNYPISAITVTIPFAGYKGTSRVAASISSPPQLLGITRTTNTSASSSSDGQLVYEIPTSTAITAASGILPLTITCQGLSFNKVFSWTRSSAARDGIDGVTMLLFTPDGTLFENGTGEITVEGYLQSGITNVTNSATWKWYQYLPNNANPPVYDYTELPTTAGTQQNPNYAYYSGKDLTVLPNAIDGYGSFKVEAVYNNGSGNKTYTQYISLTDKTDPIQVSVHSTLGTQLVNGQGSGALYVRVSQNGVQIDPIGDTEITVGTTAASGGSDGDHYILLNDTYKTATLYVKDGTWKVQPLTATYEWTFRNSQNVPITSSETLSAKFGNAYNSQTGKVTGKCLYLNKTTVDNKITADVKVTV